MPRSFTDEAIVLRTHNVGETDRFCVLLTRKYGRMTARAAGVRRTVSNRGRGLLPLHRVSLVWEERSAGCFITSVQCLDTHDAAWKDPHTFSCAGQGIELLLKLTDDGLPMPDIYALTAEFLGACRGPHSPSVAQIFALKLLRNLGYLPAGATVPARLSADLGRLLDASERLPFSSSADIPAHLSAELGSFLSSLLGNQLGVSLRAAPVSLAISSAVTPSCQ